MFFVCVTKVVESHEMMFDNLSLKNSVDIFMKIIISMYKLRRICITILVTFL